ncbi:late embryogenesis abundant protein-related / LEA protein-related [Raphanus sativus]|uniref:Late embryogenesis abundant protein 7 n=1 Tax=Raphanus sativus TaxID=3726 RepID=A0A6J0P0Y3_RAPSA|nr:late embryogenesis abundant protein 7 [Raphanus sativus]KAJ4896707.1 late embryogenesis abundant protein-related / LEA protein-related [Raphanus sativus]
MSPNQELIYKAGEATGQVQLKKEEYLNKVSHAMNQNADHHHTHSQSHAEHDQNNPSLISQASSVIQQTGGQVKNMAQGAADAVKNTLGMSPATNNPSSPAGRTHPSNPSSPAGRTHPSNPSSPAGTNRPSNPSSRNI